MLLIIEKKPLPFKMLFYIFLNFFFQRILSSSVENQNKPINEKDHTSNVNKPFLSCDQKTNNEIQIKKKLSPESENSRMNPVNCGKHINNDIATLNSVCGFLDDLKLNDRIQTSEKAIEESESISLDDKTELFTINEYYVDSYEYKDINSTTNFKSNEIQFQEDIEFMNKWNINYRKWIDILKFISELITDTFDFESILREFNKKKKKAFNNNKNSNFAKLLKGIELDSRKRFNGLIIHLCIYLHKCQIIIYDFFCLIQLKNKKAIEMSAHLNTFEKTIFKTLLNYILKIRELGYENFDKITMNFYENFVEKTYEFMLLIKREDQQLSN